MQDSPSLPQLLVEFISAKTLRDSLLLLKDHPQLLQAEAEQLLSQWVSVEPNPEHQWALKEHQQLLRRCRLEGLDRVWATHLDPFQDMGDFFSELEVTVTELSGIHGVDNLFEPLASVSHWGEQLDSFVGRITSRYRIRPARYTDLDHLAGIEKRAAQRFRETTYAHLAEGEPMPWVKLYDRFLNGQVWVVYPEGETCLVGFAVVRELDQTAYLEEIDVDPRHGRRGIGRRIVETVLQWSKQEGYPVVTLSTFRSIPWNAPFYLKMGFRTWEDRDLSPGFQLIRQQEKAAGLPLYDRVIMYRDLEFYSP